ncbi:uncharacterized protein THITE_2114837 [Thermothielavioides terrestris NRRL 8126]|jgi:triosephosphate isomerase|uniref:Triosephosphate isomerase n=1 Tax=Thermothielavioides terrestris (strain ATCC 38088 / NRRL 8126) TaxID=578455 RepID=G2R242_THETT|nr:uncharacterized protein THITE_2114837 [Thermothielavioides terrestris NRRL 8126]AEO66626.1 hypothetical protein THITE_2114837 [Thermothielavioides terrestris NRRL 8126]
MYFSHARTTAYVSSVLSLLSSPSASPSSPSPLETGTIDAFLIPDFVSLLPTLAAISAAPPPANTLLVGAQDCCAHDAGAHTGEVSPAVLREVGCALVEVGHAERRRLYGETDAVVAEKARAVVRNGMWPLVCVGEQRAPGEDGEDGVQRAAEEVLAQVTAVLEGLDAKAEVVLAYEPVWAIGAAQPASAEHVRGVVRRLRESEVVRGRRGRTRIVYGGAAGPGLWERLGGEVDGLFLGRFAHEPEQFVKLLYEVGGMGGGG